jgi:hypothetical protein
MASPKPAAKQVNLYGFERTRALLSNSFSAESVAQAARDFGQEDDITVLTIHTIADNESSVPRSPTMQPVWSSEAAKCT